MDTRNWICPALCGCEIQIRAMWIDESVFIDNTHKSYRHPAPFTIEAMSIVNVCPTHDLLRFAPTDVNPFDNGGYLKLPIANPSEAEALYVNLWGITGNNVSSAVCGKDTCVIHQVDDRKGNITIVQHPQHTKRCNHHIDDDEQHTAVFTEMAFLGNTIETLKQDSLIASDVIDPDSGTMYKDFNPGKKPDWYFDDNRDLHIKLKNMQPQDKTVISTNFSANKPLGKGQIANQVVFD